ncbi:hypothetical protein [Nonomuraea sp. NPDC046570]|uniref:hypothetical protein n=1 Tax=Nonomuraea sp. NPDC046570 TaxID=3155255 RepID=UPI00340C8347
MTQPPDEHGDILRRVLRAEADAVVPSPEGLEIIRARIERRGLRGLFWWRAGAAAGGAVLVAAAIVMVVPGLRQNVQDQFIQPVDVSSSERAKDKSATSRPEPPRQTVPKSDPAIITAVPTTRQPEPGATTGSTLKPSRGPTPKPTPTPTPTSCPTDQEVTPPDCPPPGSASPSPTPSETPSDAGVPCPIEQCPPEDSAPAPTPTEAPSPLSSG